MLLPLSTPLASRLDALAECGSTNTVLVSRAAEGWPDFSVVVTDTQTDGRGRLGRVWLAPPGKTLAVSVLLRPGLPLESFGWIPLLAGVAMARAVEQLLGSASATTSAKVGLKWPNDVLVDDLKVSGLLAELVAGGPESEAAVVVGAGLNLTIAAGELPTETSTSLSLVGADTDDLFDRALSAYLRELRGLYELFVRHGGDAEASGIRSIVRESCATLGRSVRIQLPDGGTMVAQAVDIDEKGQLVVTRAQDGVVQAVAAGDVTHLRYE